ncbi:Chitotriosidase-1 [Colletotrichum aenigma]|uniref:Chitotriosidase-1 n=1 Tax=Colletotrichum aenigma TaxID=1215731 RepID=UPI001872C580|nr:Chitotriosidase-1 [Colletotrichum aenigma]KAF5523516.1 Chitotriosidase-1 [Colletotrichum aenigma]
MRFLQVSWVTLVLSTLSRHVVAESYFALNSAYGLLQNTVAAEDLELPVGTCNANTPCVNGACCSGNGSGLCGYSPAECGAANCTSNCDAKAECGQYGKPGKQICPLGVCCSEFGFCGSTSEFCDAGCQKGFGGCGDLKRPSCSKDGGSINKRSIGYYESWANTRACSAVSPEDLNLDGLTHINFAFVFFDPSSFQIVPMDKNAGTLLNRFTKLKEKKAGLQTWVSVGGWSFNDPGPYQKAFSTMASSAGNRKMFIDGLIKFMESYGFDGMDLDWEYPTADDRGGTADDTANFVLLCKEIKAAFGTRFGYSITLPASYWYLQNFDLAGMQPFVDWFNIMSYDIHGVWDAASKFVGPIVAPHTNLTEIDLGLDLLWRAGLKPEKVVLGQGYYGRSFTLKDPNCNKPNGVCQFSGGAKEGPCSKASGILTLQEIFDIIKEKNLKPQFDEKAGVKWIHWDSDQWVSYDDSQTLMMKKSFANSRCLGGSMIWALDQVDQSSKSLQYPEDWSDEEISLSEDMIADEEVKGVCYTTKCGESCRKGDHEASQMNGQPGLSTMDRCPKNKFRRLCCNKGTTMGKCRWRGYRGLGLACTGGCADLETEITQNTNHHSDKEDQTCSGGTQSYCCAGFMPPISKEQMEEKIKDEAADAAIAAAETLALEVAAKAFCRIAITAALTPLTFIPIVGWIIRLAIQAAVPALANLCAKGIVKGGKSVFKFRGKDYDVKLDKPLTTKNDRGDRGKSDKADEKDGHCDLKDTKRLAKRAALRPKSETSTRTIQMRQTVTKTCNGALYPQPCLHYQSVIQNQNGMAALTCTTAAGGGGIRPVVEKYSKDHHTKWINGWMQSANINCQRDEYPPAAIWQGRDMRQWIRLVPGAQNGGAGQLFRGVCPAKYKMSPEQNKRLLRVVRNCKRLVSKYVVTRTATTKVMKMKFINMPNLADDGIPDNPCYPKTLIDDPGFALMTNDPWYNAHPASKRNTRLYRNAPGANIIAGKTNRPGYNKRDDEEDFNPEHFNPDDVWVDEGNSTRKATDGEVLDHLGFLRCENGDCEAELGDLGVKSLPFINPSSTVPIEVVAYATPADALPTSLANVLETASSIHEEVRSLITPAPQLEYEYEVEYED